MRTRRDSDIKTATQGARASLALLATAAVFAVVAATVPATPDADGLLRADLDGLGQVEFEQAASDAQLLALGHRLLSQHARALGVDASDFVLDDVAHSPVGVHVRGREVRGGVPVLGSSAAVHVATDGTVLAVEARPVRLPGTAAPTPVDAQVARAVALTHLGVSSPWAVASERWMVEHDGRLVDVHRVEVLDVTVPVAATVQVRAADATVLGVVDERLHIDGSALVFDPNPIVALQNNRLRQEVEFDAIDVSTQEFSDARTALDLMDVDLEGLPAGILRGPWVNAIGGTAIPLPQQGHWRVDLERSAPQFETLMAYAHLDRVQRYFQDRLGFVGDMGVNAESQEVITFPVPGYDNSFYMPSNDLMLLGGGGVDDGEDAEVILHEYGHAVHHAQVPGWGDRHEGGAMGEGFGDFLAGAFFASHSSRGFQDTCIMDWDATSYSSEDPPCLRRMDRDKSYPDDMTGSSVHADGEIWSKFLWNVRQRSVADGEAATMEPSVFDTQRTDRTLRALLASHFLLSPTATFSDAVFALQTAADQLGDAHLLAVIEDEADAIGIPVVSLG